MLEFVQAILTALSSEISLTAVAGIVAAMIASGAVAIFAWKFGRKGFAFLKNALSGRGGRI